MPRLVHIPNHREGARSKVERKQITTWQEIRTLEEEISRALRETWENGKLE